MSAILPLPETEFATLDVFDTLVTRVSGSPRTVFGCVGRRAEAEGIDAAGFAGRRVDAERKAAERVGAARMTLDDVYRELEGDYPEDVAARLEGMEVRAEVDLCVPIAAGVELLRACVARCRAVALVSDMYLPADVVRQILDRCGIGGYSALYVSCEHGETKSDGSLFRRVLSDLGAEPGQVTHYGDSLRGDFLVPRRLGMRAVLVRDGRQVSPARQLASRAAGKVRRRPVGGTLRALRLAAGDDMARRVGYSVLGPLLVELCRWVHERREEDGLGRLLFVARDGHIMRRCYELLYPGEGTTYLLASRRSTTVPMLWRNQGIDGFVRTVGLGREMEAGEILMRLGLSEGRARKLEAAHGLSDGTRLLVSELGSDSRFAPLFEEAEPEVLENSRREFTAMESYLRNEIGESRNVGLVDLGWRGSIQHAIGSALPEMGMGGVRVEGLYLGIDPLSRWWGSQDMRGFLFSPGRDEALAMREKWFNALVEALFSAPHGTVVRYVADGDGARAELAPREGGNDDSSPLFAIQGAALAFARDYASRGWGPYGFLGRGRAVVELCRLGLEPTGAEASFLGDVVFDYQEASPLARPAHGLGWYLLHPRELARDMGVCYWKPAFLRRLTGLWLPWWRLLAAVKKVARRGEAVPPEGLQAQQREAKV